jgi:hypothetical protein
MSEGDDEGRESVVALLKEHLPGVLAEYIADMEFEHRLIVTHHRTRHSVSMWKVHTTNAHFKTDLPLINTGLFFRKNGTFMYIEPYAIYPDWEVYEQWKKEEWRKQILINPHAHRIDLHPFRMSLSCYAANYPLYKILVWVSDGTYLCVIRTKRYNGHGQ